MRLLKIVKWVRLLIADIPMILIAITALLVLILIKNPITREITKEYAAYYGIVALVIDLILAKIEKTLKNRLEGTVK